MDQWAGNIAGGLVVLAIVLIVIFLVFREFFCWYWKINQRIALLTEIQRLLAANGPPLRAVEVNVPQRARPPQLCPGCGASVPVVGSVFCTQCGAKL